MRSGQLWLSAAVSTNHSPGVETSLPGALYLCLPELWQLGWWISVLATVAISTPTMPAYAGGVEEAHLAMSVGCESDVCSTRKGDLLETFETSQLCCASP